MKKSALIALIAGYLAMVAAFWMLDRVFERLPHLEDEIAYIYQAKIFAGGNIIIDSPQPTAAFWQPFVIDCNESIEKYDGLNCDGKRFGKYPPGWPLILAIGYQYQIEWAINPLIVLLTVVLTYRFGREVFGEAVGVLSAILMTISPIVILQSGTLMSHPAALFFATLFLYAVWRLDQSGRLRNKLIWGAVGGTALGMIIATRPLAGAGIAGFVILYSGLRVIIALVASLYQWWIKRGSVENTPHLEWLKQWWVRLLMLYIPLMIGTGIAYWIVYQLPYWANWFVLVVGGVIALAAMAFMVFQDPDAVPKLNPPFSRKFGWTINPLIVLSLFTILFSGLWFGFNYIATGNPTKNLYELVWEYDTVGIGPEHGRRGHTWDKAKNILKWDMECYSRDLFGWTEQPDSPPPVTQDSCMKDQAGLSWILLPFGLIFGWRRRWTYVLFGTAVVMVFSTMFYWIGAAIYSARYYYEITSILAILSAVGVVGFARQMKALQLHWVVYTLFFIIIGFSTLSFTPERLKGLYRYDQQGNRMVGRHQIETVDSWRQDLDTPVLVIAYGDVHWREVGAIMALTSPYLDSEYILARDPNQELVETLMAKFPDREVVYFWNGQFTPSLFGYVPHENNAGPDIEEVRWIDVSTPQQ